MGRLGRFSLVSFHKIFSIDGQIAPESNVRFDASLRSQNVEWGYRDSRFLIDLAAKNRLIVKRRHEMPANNHVFVFEKE